MRTVALAIAVIATLSTTSAAQSLTGKWMGQTPDGAFLTLDVVATESRLTGTVAPIQDGQSLPLTIQEGTLTGDTFTFFVMAGNQRVTFSGQVEGDSLRLRPSTAPFDVVLTRVDEFPETTLSPLVTTAPASAPAGWRAANRAATLVDDNGRQIIRIDERLGDGVVWQEGVAFTNGTIELEVRGANRPGQSFVGVAFRGVDDETYDGVYFRPFNFRADGPGRERAVQYVSHPDHPWARLREEHPGRYENPISPVPDPDGWFRARIVVEDRTVQVFVDDAREPTLTVDTITDARGSMVGLWVGNGSGGEFANLRIAPAE